MGVTGVGAFAAGIVVIDVSGSAFNLLGSAHLGVALWRVTSRTELTDLAGIGLAMVAAYEQPDWTLIEELVDRVPTVIFAAAPDDQDAGRAVAMGAFGYIGASLPLEALRRTVVGALSGEPAYSRRLLAKRLRLVAKPEFSGSALALTPRQREVVTLIAKGAADKEIARTLGITTATVQKHVTNLLRRLRVPNRAAAAAVLVGSTTWSTPAYQTSSGERVSAVSWPLRFACSGRDSSVAGHSLRRL